LFKSNDINLLEWVLSKKKKKIAIVGDYVEKLGYKLVQQLWKKVWLFLKD
jgi:hypothetical protein